jgi:hypothetical protein
VQIEAICIHKVRVAAVEVAMEVVMDSNHQESRDTAPLKASEKAIKGGISCVAAIAIYERIMLFIFQSINDGEVLSSCINHKLHSLQAV